MSRHRRARSNRRRGRMPLPSSGIVLVQQCPKSINEFISIRLGWSIDQCGQDISSTYLHGHQTVVDHYFLGQKIGANRGLVLIIELLVDVLVHQ